MFKNRKKLKLTLVKVASLLLSSLFLLTITGCVCKRGPAMIRESGFLITS